MVFGLAMRRSLLSSTSPRRSPLLIPSRPVISSSYCTSASSTSRDVDSHSSLDFSKLVFRNSNPTLGWKRKDMMKKQIARIEKKYEKMAKDYSAATAPRHELSGPAPSRLEVLRDSTEHDHSYSNLATPHEDRSRFVDDIDFNHMASGENALGYVHCAVMQKSKFHIYAVCYDYKTMKEITKPELIKEEEEGEAEAADSVLTGQVYGSGSGSVPVVFASSAEGDFREQLYGGKDKSASFLVGREFGRRLREFGIGRVKVDRLGRKKHGVVMEFERGLSAAGIKQVY
eukprot:Nk52_evm1s2483 gene=Nk52_evmTU1s2483